jgi:hypothetical protein
MIASLHVATGAAIGIAVARKLRPRAFQVLVAIVVGVCGHLLMDAIPHSDYAFLPEAIVPWVGLGEACIAIGVVALLARRQLRAGEWLPVAAGVAASMAPDVKFAARLFAPQYEAAVTRVTDAVHGLHATKPLHVWLAFSAEAFLALTFFYLFWRIVRGRGAAVRA